MPAEVRRGKSGGVPVEIDTTLKLGHLPPPTRLSGDSKKAPRSVKISSERTSGGNGKWPPPKHRQRSKGIRLKVSIRRRIFLLLTEPQTSLASAVFFVVLAVAICASNLFLMLQ